MNINFSRFLFTYESRDTFDGPEANNKEVSWFEKILSELLRVIREKYLTV